MIATIENTVSSTTVGLRLLGVVEAIPKLYLIWASPLLLVLVLLVPPWQHPDETTHFLRAAQISEGMLGGHRFESTAGGLADPAIGAALLPFNSIPFHPDLKVTQGMYAIADVRWTGKAQEIPFPNTAIYPPFLYLPDVLAIWIGRAFDLTVIRTLYLARSANAISSLLITLAALSLARRSRCGLAVIATLPMTLTLNVSASQDALIISLVLLAVGATDRIIDEGRTASDWEIVLIMLALVFPAMARPPYAVLSGLLFLSNTSKSVRAWTAGTVIVVCTTTWWAYSASTVMLIPSADTPIHRMFSAADPIRVLTAAWATLTTQAGEIGEQMIGVLGWLDTRLPLLFVQMTSLLLVISLLGATAGPSRRPWQAAAVIAIGVFILFLIFYFYTAPDMPVLSLQGRYFLPFAAVLTLAVPHLPRIGIASLAIASAGFMLLLWLEPAIVIRTLIERYYLFAG